MKKELLIIQLFSILTLMVFSYEIISPVAFAQETDTLHIIENAQVPHWRVIKGLVRNNKVKGPFYTRTMSFSPNGDLWLMVYDRQYIYDGFSYKEIESPGKFHNIRFSPEGKAWSLYNQAEHDVLFQREIVGLQHYDQETNVWHPIEIPEINWIDRVEAFKFRFLPLNDQEILIVNPHRISKFNVFIRKSTPIIDHTHFDIGKFLHVIETKSHYVWIMAENGLIQFNTQNNETKSFPLLHNVEWVPQNGERVFPYCDQDGTFIYFVRSKSDGTNFILKCNRDGIKLTSTVVDDLFIGFPGLNESFWFINKAYNVFRSNPSHFEDFHLVEIENDDLRCALYEREGFFWLGSVFRLIRHAAPIWYSPNLSIGSLLVNKNMIENHEERIFFCSNGRFYMLQDNKTESFQIKDTDVFQHDGKVYDLGNNRIVVHNHGQFYIFHTDLKQFRSVKHPEKRYVSRQVTRSNIKNKVITVTLDNENIHTHWRLEEFDGDTFNSIIDFVEKPITPFNEILYHIQTTSGDQYFIAKEKGLYKLENRQLQPIRDIELDKFNPKCMIEISDSTIWIGSDEGIFEFDGKNIQLIHKSFSSPVTCLAKDQLNQIWVGTEQSLYRLVNNNWIENTFDDGLADNNIKDILIRNNGEIWISSLLGIRKYYPEHDLDSPETFLDENNIPEFTPSGEGQVRFYGEDKWQYTNADRLTFSFRMNNEAWSPFKTITDAQFTHLAYGKHRFEVRAMDRNGNIDPTPVSFPVHVPYPWYLQPAFLIMSTLGSLLTLFFAYMATRNYLFLRTSLTETQRTVALLERTQSKLAKSKAQAEEEKYNAISATKAKDGFLARMSHEIRTPLNGIIGNLELITPLNFHTKGKIFLQTAKISANTLLGIIGDVLDFAKIEADKMELEPKVIALHQLFTETISVMNARAEEKQIVLTSHLADEIPSAIKIDPIRLRQVMINLIGNSIKFTDQGSVNVFLSCHSTTNDQTTIHFEVKDTGIGFDVSCKHKLFREFEQDDTSNKTAEGTGLGLAICKRIIEMMGGTLDCDSKPQVGSRFWFDVSLPLADASEITEENGNRDKELPRFEVKHPILVLDDKELNRVLAINQLEKLGIPAEDASSGKNALEKIKQKQYSLLLVDCSMPGMDGFEFTQKFREWENGNPERIPVIAMTAHVVSEIQQRCIQAGMDDYLAKPVRIEDLTSILLKWLTTDEHTTPFDLQHIMEELELDEMEEVMEVAEGYCADLESKFSELKHQFENQNKKEFYTTLQSILRIASRMKAVPLLHAVEILIQNQEESWVEIKKLYTEVKLVYSSLIEFINEQHLHE